MKETGFEPGQQREKEKIHSIIHFSQRFLDTDNVPDLQEITEFMRTLTGAVCVVFNQYDDDGRGLTTKAVAVASQHLLKAVELLGFNPTGKKWPHDPQRQEKIQKDMVTIFEDLQTLTGKAIRPSAVILLEKTFDIGQAVIVKTMKREKAMGDFTLIMSRSTPMESQELVTHFAAQVGLYLDRVQYEQNLIESEEKHRLLFETMSPGVIYQDTDGYIISANPAAELMIGITIDQMQGKTSVDPRWKMIMEDGTSVPGWEHPSMIALRTGKKIGPVTRGIYIPERYTYVWLLITAIPLFREGEDKPFQVYAIFDDITKRKRVEDALRMAKQEAESANQAKSRYLAHMNHEIRTPLNGLMGFLQLMEDTQLDEVQQDFLEYMKLSTNHMLSLINNVLEMAKIEAGVMKLTRQVVHLREEIHQSMAPLRSLSQKKEIRLELIIDENLPAQVEGDPDRLRQILVNLGGNAVKFTEKGWVKISVRCLESDQAHHMLELVVEDTGPGMTRETLHNLFRPFFQVDDGSMLQSKGSGLGMAITRELVELMGGRIKAESTLGKGTRVEVTLLLKRVPDSK